MSWFKRKKKSTVVNFTADLKESTFWSEVKSFIWEVVEIVLISLAIIIPVRYFLIQPFYVQGASMSPNFYDRDYLIVDEISYRFREPRRGEVIVFRNPQNPREDFIKRIIGLPGEKIKIEKNTVSLWRPQDSTWQPLEENYLPSPLGTSAPREDFSEVTLGRGEYYVLGDNRGSSLDSRFFGPIDQSQIIGRIWLRGWPPTRLMVFSPPLYNF